MATKDVSGSNIADNTSANLTVTEAEGRKAQKEGALEDVKEVAKNARHALTDGNLPGDPPNNPYHGWDEIQPWADLLTLGVDAFKDRVSESPKEYDPIPDEKVYGLLALERNGQNRAPYVVAMLKRLPDVDGTNMPGGGPDYVNNVTAITDLAKL